MTNTRRQPIVSVVEKERCRVRAALHSGAKPVNLIQDFPGGPLKLVVETPDGEHLECLIPKSCEQQTLVWFTAMTE